jgi:hypothetical protein
MYQLVVSNVVRISISFNYSFDSCGILNQYDLHLILKQCITTKIINSDFIDDFIDADNIDGFEDDNDLFDENGEDENDYTSVSRITKSNNAQQSEPVDNNNNINSSQSRNHPSQSIGVSFDDHIPSAQLRSQIEFN